MITFALELVKDVATSVLQTRITDQRGKAIRTFITLHDGVERVERASEALLTQCEAYADSAGEKVDAGKLRRHIYDFASAASEFAGVYLNVARVLQVFDSDLASALRGVGSVKLQLSRSLLEVTAPTVCVDSSIPWQQRHYHLRVLDYGAVGYSASELREQWASRTQEADPTRAETPLDSVLPPSQWITAGGGKQDPKRFEDRLVNLLAVKHLSFDDYAELRSLVAEAQPRLIELKNARTKLEEFLAKNFTVTDFFS